MDKYKILVVILPAAANTSGLKGLLETYAEAVFESKQYNYIIFITPYDVENGIEKAQYKLIRESLQGRSLDAIISPFVKEYNPEYIGVVNLAGEIGFAYDINKSLKKATDMLISGGFDSVVEVAPTRGLCWVADAVGHLGKKHPIATYHTSNRPAKDATRPGWFEETERVYVTYGSVFNHLGYMLGGAVGLCVKE